MPYAIRFCNNEKGFSSKRDGCLMKGALSRRILLVDSEEDQRLILASLLREENHQVTICGKSSEALDFFEKEEFDFVIVEHLPLVLDGLHLLEQFKQLKTNIPVLVISSQYEIEPYLVAMNRGALDYFGKPVDYVEIQRLIKAYAKSETGGYKRAAHE